VTGEAFNVGCGGRITINELVDTLNDVLGTDIDPVYDVLMKVLSVVGARPQFIKAFVVSKDLRKAHEEVLVHTGQHYDEELSGVFFEELEIRYFPTDVSSGTEASL